MTDESSLTPPNTLPAQSVEKNCENREVGSGVLGDSPFLPDELSLFPLFLFESVVARVNDSPHPHTVLASSRSKPTGVAAALRSSTSSDRRLLQETQRGRSLLASFRLKLVNRWQSFRRLTDVTEAGNAPSPPKCERVRRSVRPSSVGRSSTPPPSPPLSWGGTGRGRAPSLHRSLALVVKLRTAGGGLEDGS